MRFFLYTLSILLLVIPFLMYVVCFPLIYNFAGDLPFRLYHKQQLEDMELFLDILDNNPEQSLDDYPEQSFDDWFEQNKKMCEREQMKLIQKDAKPLLWGFLLSDIISLALVFLVIGRKYSINPVFCVCYIMLAVMYLVWWVKTFHFIYTL